MKVGFPSIEIRNALTNEERESVYRLRYNVIAEETKADLSQKAYAEQKLSDDLDDLADHYAVFAEERIIGSLRVHSFSWDPRFRCYYELYGLERFLMSYPLVPITFFSYLVVHKSYRESAALLLLLKAGRAAIRERQSGLVFCHCPPEWEKSFGALGFRSYKGNVYLPGLGLQTPLLMNGMFPI